METLGCPVVRDLAVLRSSRESGKTKAAHHQLDRATSNHHVLAQDQLGMQPSSTVGLARGIMHLPDHIGEHDVTHRRGESLRFREV